MTADPFSAFDPVNDTPVTIVFGTFNYRSVIHEWINHALSTCDHWRIICMDKELVAWLNEIGHGDCAVSFRDLFPDVSLQHLKNSSGKLRPGKLFELRKKLFLALVKSGRDFIHSDADAFWLRNPVPWLTQHIEFDLLISQGTHAPKQHFDRYHFTLCAGFFLCRANVRTQNYFQQVAERKVLDQENMNIILADDPEANWRIHQPTVWVSSSGRVGGKWRKIPVLLCAMLAWGQRSTPWLLRFIKTSLSQLHCPGRLCWLRSLLRYIYISSEIIKGKFSNGLTIGVIPMHLITRIEYQWSNPPFVVHTPVQKRKAKNADRN